ncbi:MAG: hypothetical protein WCQ50_09780 [Spirochaetota bacterium]
MEEIGNTEAIQKEILEEARKTAERLHREADEEVVHIATAAVERIKASKNEVARLSEIWIARQRGETLARVPLEKIRYKTELVDGRVRSAMKDFMATIGEDQLLSLTDSLLRGAASVFAGREVTLRYKGLPASRARASVKSVLGVPEPKEAIEDPTLPAAGVVVKSVDGKLTLAATMDLIEAELLDIKRGDLAKALCAEALKA